MIPTDFEDDVDKDELSKEDSRLPAIDEEEEPNEEISEQITRLDEFYGAGLINKYFFNRNYRSIKKL